MYWFSLSVEWVSVALQLSIFIVLGRRNLYRRFPLFSAYTAFLILTTILRSAVLSRPRLYFYLYWFTEPGEVLLALASVHESFVKVFGTLYRVWWFRLLFPAAVLLTLAYSSWRTTAHPYAHGNHITGTVITLIIVTQYLILATAVLFFALVRFLNISWRIYEFRFVFGFGFAAIAGILGGIFRSQYGPQYPFLSEQLPGLAFLAAVLIWLSAVLSPEPTNGKNFNAALLRELHQSLQHQLEVIKRLFRWE